MYILYTVLIHAKRKFNYVEKARKLYRRATTWFQTPCTRVSIPHSSLGHWQVCREDGPEHHSGHRRGGCFQFGRSETTCRLQLSEFGQRYPQCFGKAVETHPSNSPGDFDVRHSQVSSVATSKLGCFSAGSESLVSGMWTRQTRSSARVRHPQRILASLQADPPGSWCFFPQPRPRTVLPFSFPWRRRKRQTSTRVVSHKLALLPGKGFASSAGPPKT